MDRGAECATIAQPEDWELEGGLTAWRADLPLMAPYAR